MSYILDVKHWTVDNTFWKLIENCLWCQKTGEEQTESQEQEALENYEAISFNVCTGQGIRKGCQAACLWAFRKVGSYYKESE